MFAFSICLSSDSHPRVVIFDLLYQAGFIYMVTQSLGLPLKKTVFTVLKNGWCILKLYQVSAHLKNTFFKTNF